MQLAQLPQAARFVAGIYTERAAVAWAAHRGDLFSELVRYPGQTDPYPLYERMRARGPLLRTRPQNWTTISYPISREVLRDRRLGVVPEEQVGFNPRDLLDLSLLSMNPPDHTRLRRLAGPAFSPRRMQTYATLVDEVVEEVLDDAERRGEFELMATVASPLPIKVITKLLGMPPDHLRFRRIGATMAKALDGVNSFGEARRLAAVQSELWSVLEELIVERRHHPGDDLVSTLIKEHGDGFEVSELVSLVQLLFVAGFETTVNAIGNGVRWLLADRTQWQRLVDDPTLAGAAAEEVLRFDPPVQAAGRVANDEVELAGQRIERNQWVIAMVAAANRDPDVYDHPNRFDLTRENPPEHLAFSGGIHYCLGAPLARLELTRALAGLARRFPDLRSTGPVRMRQASILRGPLEVPLAVC